MIGSVSAEGMFDIFTSSSDSANNETNFIVGFNPEFPPFTYKDDNGSYTGFDLELAQEVAKRNNWTFVPQPIIDWNSKQVEINSGEFDCLGVNSPLTAENPIMPGLMLTLIILR